MKHIAKIALMCLALQATASAEIYPAAYLVTDTDPARDMITLTTATGLNFEWYEIEDWMPGDIAAAIMSDNGTPDDITDDEILQLRYAGYIY